MSDKSNDHINEIALRDGEAVAVVVALIGAAKSQQSFDAEAFKAKVESSLSSLESKGAGHYTEIVRIAMAHLLAS